MNPEHLKILKQGVEQWNKWWEHSNVSRNPWLAPREDKPPHWFWALTVGDFTKAELDGADLTGTNLSGAHLLGADLSGARLSGANLSGAKLHEADLYRADLRGADLSGADLLLANISVADLSGANLRNASLGRANLSGANLSTANLQQADLSGHIPGGASLGSDPSGADFRQRGLGADLSGAILREADFTQAKVGFTIFADVDLSVAMGLETVRHSGPSSVGIDTIYKSRGKIPEVFLRGCGVPDEFIRYIGSMVGRPIEFYSCFISYSTKDQEFADGLYADLQNKGVRCWFAPHDVHGGRKLHEQLDEAIRLHDKLLLILSEHSMNSDWVGTEIANAREREQREKRQMLFPITLVPFEEVKNWKLFDADRGKDSAREIREYFIPDFSNWKDHDSYQKAFQRLVGDLKAVASG